MKKATTRTIKVMIDSKSLSPLDINELEKWEDEGGQPASSTTDFLKSLAPLKKGEIFEVVGGDIHYEDGKIYFETEIEILALP